GTGSAAAYDHAIALLGSVKNVLADERQHAFGVEDLVGGEIGHGIGRVVPEDLAVAVVPGIEALVVLGGDLRRNACGAGRGTGQFRVEQPPAQVRGQI